jgi:hypothetical protein
MAIAPKIKVAKSPGKIEGVAVVVILLAVVVLSKVLVVVDVEVVVMVKVACEIVADCT